VGATGSQSQGSWLLFFELALNGRLPAVELEGGGGGGVVFETDVLGGGIFWVGGGG